MAGRHSLKWGGIWSRRGSGRFNVENAIVRYSTEADLLANIPNTVTTSFGTPPFIGRDYQIGLFAQDDWRVSRRLVVNLGLRYDYFSNYVAYGKDQNNPFLSAGLFNPDGILDSRFRIGPVRPIDNPIEPDRLNLGPRIGFAYNPDREGRTVVRGGYSVMFSQVPIAWFLLSVGRSEVIPFRTVFSRAEVAQLGLKFPTYNEDVFPILQRLGQVRIESTFDPHLQNPYAHNFYLGVQRTLTSSMMFETALVSTRGVKFTMRRDANLPDRITGERPNPAVGGFRYLDNSQQTFHYSSQSSLRKQFTRGLLFAIHYTFGKTLAYSGGDNATDAEGEAT
ncbi:MAG: TonB-dependent receptor domain-containing protein, partial [Gammaproteobacteria bacterium]